MRIAVLGSQGQLGRDLCPRLPGEVIPLTRKEADLTRTDQLRSTLEELRPGVVVNCAAYNFVDRAEGEPEAAFRVNTWGVRELASICRDLDARLVHFSTDHVFGLDEDRREPWAEDCPPGPVSVYGLSKLAGEYLVRSVCPRHLVIRTCGLYGVWGSGGKGGNFVETMLRLAREGKPLRVVADQVCTPSYTVDVARAVVGLLSSSAHGLFHVTSSGACSWYELTREIVAAAGIEAEVTPITSADYGAPARRPRYSVLGMERLEAAGVRPPRPWREALAAYLEERRTRD